MIIECKDTKNKGNYQIIFLDYNKLLITLRYTYRVSSFWTTRKIRMVASYSNSFGRCRIQ